MENSLSDLMTRSPAMAILRNFPPATAVQLAQRAWDVGIELVEVPIQTPDAVPSLEAVIRAGNERGKPVGAGTITTKEQLRLSHRLGVAFTVSPGLSRGVVELCTDLGVPHLPGVSSASEIQKAIRLGCTWLKAFPANVLGPDWFVAMKRGPFPGVSFVATGGVDVRNATDFLDAGATAVGVGSALMDEAQIDLLAELIRLRSVRAE